MSKLDKDVKLDNKHQRRQKMSRTTMTIEKETENVKMESKIRKWENIPKETINIENMLHV